MNRLCTTVIAGFLCLLALAVSSAAQTTSQPSDVTRPQAGGVLAVAIDGKPLHLNSAIASGIYTGIPAAQIFASLLRINHNWEYEPYLAETWDVSPDGRTVTFYLRPGATFHDGAPITSEDVAFSIMTIKTYHPFSTMLAPVEGVETPDPLTAAVRLTAPHPALLMAAASPMMPILPKHVYGDGQDLKTHPANLKPVGSGPFRFVSLSDNEIVLEKYPGFFLPGRPYLDKLLIKIMETPVIPIALETGSVHVQGFSAATDARIPIANLENHCLEYSGYEGIGGIVWLAFNVRKPPLNDACVRRAFAYTIDRNFLAQAIYGDKGKAATGPIISGSPFYSDQVNTYPVNTDLANRLLDEAGYPRNDKGVRFTLTLAPLTSIRSGSSEYVQSVLSRKIGVELNILHFDAFSDWAKYVAGGDFELALDTVFTWGDPVIGVHRTYSSRNIRPGVIWSNTQGYSNPRVDEVLDAAAIETDVVRRKALYAEFQKLVTDDLPVYWLYELPYATIRHRHLMGLDHASIWGLMFPFTDVYWNISK